MSTERQFTGVFIPAHIWTSNDLIPAEKMLLGEVSALSQKTGWCEAGRQHFAQWLQCTPENVSYYISKLQRLGYLEVQPRPGYQNRMKVVVERFYMEENEGIPVNGIYGGGKGDLRVPVNGIYGGGKGDLPLKYNINKKNKKEDEKNGDPSSSQKNHPVEARTEEKDPPRCAAPPPSETAKPQPQGPAIVVEDEIAQMREDYRLKESFSIGRKIPSDFFSDYIEAFRIDVIGRGVTYWRKDEIRSHFLNFSGIRFQMSSRQSGKPNSYQPNSHYRQSQDAAPQYRRMDLSDM